jgi:hypothetical protein
VVLEELEPDFGLEIERGGSFEQDLLVCLAERDVGWVWAVLGDEVLATNLFLTWETGTDLVFWWWLRRVVSFGVKESIEGARPPRRVVPTCAR